MPPAQPPLPPRAVTPWAYTWGDWAFNAGAADHRWFHNACAPDDVIAWMRREWEDSGDAEGGPEGRPRRLPTEEVERG